MPNDHSLMFVRRLLKPETVKAIEAMDLTAQQIADRCASGWAAETLALEASGELLPRLKAQAEAKAEIAEVRRWAFNPTPEEQARRVEARKELAKARAEDAAEMARTCRQEPTPEQLAAQDQFLDKLAKPAPPVQ